MRTSLITVMGMVGLLGCNQLPDVVVPDGGIGCQEHDGGKTRDLSGSSSTCPAVKGLSGDVLLCADFSQIQSLNDPRLMGWDFVTNCGGNLWEIANGKLQIKNFSSFASTCGFLMKPLSANDYGKYNTFTLSMVHTPDLNKLKQWAAVYLSQAQDNQQMWYSTGANPRQVSTIAVARAALPNGGNGVYQPLLQITSTIAGGATGWQIESLAIVGSL